MNNAERQKTVELIKKAKELRTAQKRYFKNRTATHLEESKQIESEFDQILSKFVITGDQINIVEQKNLFS